MTLLQTVQDNVLSLPGFRPELCLTAGVVVLLVLDLLWRRSPARVARLAVAALLVLAAAGALLALQPPDATWLFNRMLVTDRFATFFKWLFLGAGAVTVVTAALGAELAPARLGEFYALLTAIVLGMFLMASASDLLMMYLAIELVSMTSYALAGFRRGDRRATEAALPVVTFERDSVLVNTLQSLLRQDPAPREIIVVDQTRKHDSETQKFLDALIEQRQIDLAPRTPRRWLRRGFAWLARCAGGDFISRARRII